MANTVSRRNFIKGIGATAGATLLASAGLPLALANDPRAVTAAKQTGGVMASQMVAPQVELLISDVIGFGLTSDAWEGAFGWVTFRMHAGWHNGESVYYIQTDTSDADVAASAGLVHVPLLTAALAAEGATKPVYVFTNGADEQVNVLSTTPASEDFTSAWQVTEVTFTGDASVLTSEADILAAVDAGTATVNPLSIVVNCPVVKWAGGELAEDTEKVGYLGTGPLIEPVNTDNMTVTFKLHECYPGSRYIITDTSAAPMAPMMAISPSPVTQALVGVGATDEIWVFANGIPGSGVMGFQPAIFDHSAGDPIWSPFWDHFTVSWVDEGNARVLTSSDEIRELIESGELELFNGTPNSHPNGFVVNCPVPIKAANTFQPS